MRTMTLLTLLALAGCAAPQPLEDARAWAWEQHAYTAERTGTLDGNCVDKSTAIGARLRAQGYAVEYLVGYRRDQPDVLHMAPVVDGEYVVDYDRVWSRGSYPWRAITFAEIEEARR